MCTLTPSPTVPHAADSSSSACRYTVVRLGAAADVLGVRQRQQPGLAQGAERLAGEVAPLLGVRGPGRELAGGDLADQAQQVPGLLGGQLALDGRGHGGGLLRVRVGGTTADRVAAPSPCAHSRTPPPPTPR